MAEVHEHQLEGCAPVPLASYLKALGVLRLVAEQADEEATGCWRDEQFVLRTKLSRDEMIRFFVESYEPSPILSPWNAGSGFYHQESKTKEKDASGKLVKTGRRDQTTEATKNLERLLSSTANRLAAFRNAAAAAKAQLQGRRLDIAPKEDAKANLILMCRSSLPDTAGIWIDASATLVTKGLAFPPLLGSGGNDGKLDFAKIFLQTVLELMDPYSGAAKDGVQRLFEAAILGACSPGSSGLVISQFAGGDSGGLNSGVGFDGRSNGNPWDLVLEIEGSLLLSSSAVRRLGAVDGSDSAFPFMTPRGGALAAGAGSVAVSDEGSARGEFWAPIWGKPASLEELGTLFREGRAVVKRRIARNSIDFARAVAQLGVSRGLAHFDRHAFEQRNGNMYVGLSLPRRRVPRAPPTDLLSDFDQGRWLDAVRAAFRDNGSAALVDTARGLDDALFRLASDASPNAVQEGLVAIGRVPLECAHRPKLRSSDAGRQSLRPPPRLNALWRTMADDGSAEFQLAAALAGMMGESASGAAFPFRAHLAPIAAVDQRLFDQWSDTTEAKARVIWTRRDLLRDATAVLERRLVEAQRTEFVTRTGRTQLPLQSMNAAPLWAVIDFLAGATDDTRIAELTAGLAWVGQGIGTARTPSARRYTSDRRDETPPFLYAIFKPLFNPAGVGVESNDRRQIRPLALLRLLEAGQVETAARRAQLLARGAGMPTPFLRHAISGTRDTRRLTAALAFPIYEWRKLTDRAYPDPSKETLNHAN